MQHPPDAPRIRLEATRMGRNFPDLDGDKRPSDVLMPEFALGQDRSDA
jgi:hypothetical protein